MLFFFFFFSWTIHFTSLIHLPVGSVAGGEGSSRIHDTGMRLFQSRSWPSVSPKSRSGLHTPSSPSIHPNRLADPQYPPKSRNLPRHLFKSRNLPSVSTQIKEWTPLSPPQYPNKLSSWPPSSPTSIHPNQVIYPRYPSKSSNLPQYPSKSSSLPLYPSKSSNLPMYPSKSRNWPWQQQISACSSQETGVDVVLSPQESCHTWSISQKWHSSANRSN